MDSITDLLSQYALIIFIRKPELGKVKTRLATTIGNEKALEIYKSLLEHTLEIAKQVQARKFIFYSDGMVVDDNWNLPGFEKRDQIGDDLGEKMSNAFNALLLNYNKVVIIGSDCFELTSELISEAFEQLNKSDVAIGPAKDGGYYLLGMKKCISELFLNKKWSSSNVYSSTIKNLQDMGLSFYELPILSDVDTQGDLPLRFQQDYFI